MRQHFQWVGLSPRILLPWLLILAVGLVMLYSVTSPRPDLEPGEEAGPVVSRSFFHKQIVWMAIGLVALLVASMIPFWIWKDYLAWILYGFGLLLLLLLLLLPPMRAGTHRWILIGPIGFQPSEFVKIVMIILLSSSLASRRGDPNRPGFVLAALGLVLVPAALVLKQPDLGTAMTFLWLLVPMLLWRGLTPMSLAIMLSPGLSALIVLYGQTQGGAGYGPAHLVWGLFLLLVFLLALWHRAMGLVERVVYFLSSILMGLAVPMLWNLLRPYQQQRILVFFQPDLDRLGAGYQLFQSKVAIGSGGLLGRGYLEGTQKGLAFLPARHTDFIFSVLGEEFGFAGAAVVLGLYAWLIVEGFRLAGKVRHPFGQLLSVGVSSYLLFHVFVNVAMTVGLAPVTGLPLPGVSFGGSALVAASFLLGMQINVARNWGRY